MHIAPFAHLLGAHNIVIGHVHTACIGNTTVDHYNLTMIARPDVVYPGKTHWVVLVDVDAVGTQTLDVMFLQWLVVRVVTKPVEQRTYLYTLLALLAQYVEQQRGYRVVAKIKILKVYTALGLSDILEQKVELILTRHNQLYLVMWVEVNTNSFHLAHYQRVACLSFSNQRNQQE